MKQTDLGLNLTTKRTRKREFLAEMERVVPWVALVALIAPYAPEGKRGRPPFAVETMLRIHFMQQWFTLSDPAMEEALHDVPLFREFAGLNWDTAVPDETTILRFRRLLEEHKLAPQILALVNELLGAKGLLLRAGTVVDATLIAAPSSTKNASGERDPEMKQSPLACSSALTVASICSASLWRSSRCLKRKMLDSLGMLSSQCDRPAKSRKAGTSCKASSMAGSLSLNHCCMKWMRSRICTEKGCWPRCPHSGA